MKNPKKFLLKIFILVCLCTITLIMGILAACSATGNSPTAAEYEYEYDYRAPFVDGCDEDMTIDGETAESVWADQAYYSNTLSGIEMTATTYFTDLGLYVAGTVFDTNVYWRNNYDFNSNSTIAFYIYATPRDEIKDLGIKNVRMNAKRVRSDTLTRVNAKTKVLGELNSGETEGMSYEFFIRWDRLGVAEKPKTVYMLMEYNRISSADDTYGYVLRNYPWDMWDSPQTYFEFGEDGYKNTDSESALLGDTVTGISKTSAWRDNGDGSFSSVLGGMNVQHKLYVKRPATSNYSFECVVLPNEALCGDHAPTFGLMSYDDNAYVNTMRIRMSEEAVNNNQITFSILNNYGATWNDSGIVWNDYGDYAYKSPHDFKTDGVKIKVLKYGEKFYYFINDTLAYTSSLAVHEGNVYAGIWSLNAGITVKDVSFVDYAENVDGLKAEMTGMGYAMIEIAEYVAGGEITGPTVCALGEECTFTLSVNIGARLQSVTLNGADVTEQVKSSIANGKFTLKIEDNAAVDYSFERLTEGDGTYQVSGTVTDVFSAAAVSGAEITLVGKNSADLFYTLTSDAKGEFSLLLPEDEYEVTVSKPKYNVYRKTLAVEQGQTQTIALVRASLGWNFTEDALTLGGEEGLWTYEGQETTSSATVSEVGAAECAYTWLNNVTADQNFMLSYTLSAVDILSSGDSAPYVGVALSEDGSKIVAGGIIFTPNDLTRVRYRLTSYSPSNNVYYDNWNSYFEINKDLTSTDTVRISFARKVDAGIATYYLCIDGELAAVWSMTSDDVKNVTGKAEIGLLVQGASATFSDFAYTFDDEEIDAVVSPTVVGGNTVLSNGTTVSGSGTWTIDGNEAASAAATSGAKRVVLLGGQIIAPDMQFTLSATISGISTAGTNPCISLYLSDGTNQIDIGIVMDKASSKQLRFRMRDEANAATYYSNWNYYLTLDKDITAGGTETEVTFKRAKDASGIMKYYIIIDGTNAAEWNADTYDMGSEAAIGFMVDNAGANLKNIDFSAIE